jgi:hypothetical protein
MYKCLILILINHLEAWLDINHMIFLLDPKKWNLLLQFTPLKLEHVDDYII